LTDVKRWSPAPGAARPRDGHFAGRSGCDIGIFEKNLADAQNVVAEIKKLGKKAYAVEAM